MNDVMSELWSREGIINNLISTAILIVVVLLMRHFALRTVRRMDISSTDTLRSWIVQIRNMALIIVAMGIIIIWSGEIREFAFSIAAFAVAVVIGTKELILCFLGGVLKTGSRAFRIGDRIDVAGLRGDVVDMNFFTTTIFEIGPGHMLHQYTGRKLTIPNSLFLTHAITNERFTAKYFFHTFSIPINIHDDWELAKSVLLDAANKECASFIDDSQRYIQRIGQIEGLDTPNVNPRVSVHVASTDEIKLLIRIPSPPHKQGHMEQAIIERFLKEVPRINRGHVGRTREF